MKTQRLVSIVLFVLTVSTAFPQRGKSYNVWVTLVDKTQVKGYMYTANETELRILKQDFTPFAIDPETIETISFRRDGHIGKGAWLGAVSGLVLGSAVGYASESGSGWEEVGAFGGAIIGAPIGALVGVGIGSAKKRFTIGGDRQSYLSQLPALQKYVHL